MRRRMSSGRKLRISSPANMIRPLSCSSSRFIILSRVDLPEPELPRITVNSPRAMLRERSSMTFTPLKALETCCSSIIDVGLQRQAKGLEQGIRRNRHGHHGHHTEQHQIQRTAKQALKHDSPKT